MGLVALFSDMTKFVQFSLGNLDICSTISIVSSSHSPLVFLRQSTEAFGRISCVFHVIVDLDPEVDSPLALENLDITFTRTLYLAVVAPDSSVLGSFWENFKHFRRECGLGS